ncbi:macro domain-containing protein [Rapidithrix thailandica]|uniref:Macro domain-containing protein n=1 Tax=Rapidithrix thailandica TaxID=413964 RepID=A0AAW9SEG2_9BACT
MIREITGDLILQAQDFDVIVHGANCFCTMGSGIARQIRQTFPEAFEVDQQTTKGDRDKLGTLTFTQNTHPIVVNAYTQYRYGRDKMHCDYEAVKSCMQALKQQFSGKKIGMPLIGAGLAGGDWEIIFSIIQEELADEDVTIVKWEGK